MKERTRRRTTEQGKGDELWERSKSGVKWSTRLERRRIRKVRRRTVYVVVRGVLGASSALVGVESTSALSYASSTVQQLLLVGWPARRHSMSRNLMGQTKP